MTAITDLTTCGFVFEAMPHPGVATPAQRYRMLLKHALRSLGLRCVGVMPVQDPGHPLPPLPPELDPRQSEPPF